MAPAGMLEAMGPLSGALTSPLEEAAVEAGNEGLLLGMKKTVVAGATTFADVFKGAGKLVSHNAFL